LYQSLKLGLAVNRIRFDDYLDTLSRAYDIDKHSSPKVSLIQASKDRWSGANTQVYARGMLVAFLCDLALLDSSKGKTSVTDLLHDLYMAHRPPAAAADGNEAVLALLRSHQELRPLIDRYITGSDPVDWDGLISQAGLVADAGNKLSVSPKLSGKQRDLLDKMGYNNWRKLPTTRK
jgi:predicted metalloprotease with PDZ domain